jgi:diguanylate cyclase (GGDEF)-like protein
MISIRKYLDGSPQPEDVGAEQPRNRRNPETPQTLAVEAYRAALAEMGRSSVDACPATGPALERSLLQAADALSLAATLDTFASSGNTVRRELQDWGRATARHYHAKAGEVKQVLLSMTQTVASVGERDERCAEQMHSLTSNLSRIATLDDLSTMRASIERSAADLKQSVERMVTDGATIFDQFHATVATFQARLEQAEQAASCDALTRLRSRLCMEVQLDDRAAAGKPFCVALFDIDGFKHVNDTYGHVVGDELLKQFATELRSACRSSDIVGRWGGDEFVVLLECNLDVAAAQIERVSKWVCGSYVVDGVAGPVKLSLTASVGVAQFTPPETVKELLDRADAAMYRQKSSAHAPVPAS